MAFFEERGRAESFGRAARNYDQYRPQYPSSVVETIIGSSALGSPRVLDVGSGTGILAEQLREAGCEVLAVEPASQMAAVAREKGLTVEVSTFEDWEPLNRTFDIVTFGQSFHWVDPSLALPQIARLLTPDGILALVWNDIQASGEVGNILMTILERFTPAPKTPAETPTGKHPVLQDLERNGFDAAERRFDETMNYSRDAWLSMVFTYSAQLTMDPERRNQMYDEMFAAIPDDGLQAHNEGRLILAYRSG